MKNKIILLIASLYTILGWTQKPIFTQAKLESARVYFNSAELAHTVNVHIPKGNSEIVVSNIANFLDENTVKVGATGKVTVMSVQFSNRYIEEYDSAVDSPAIKPVKDSIQLVESELGKLNNKITTHRKTIELLDAAKPSSSTQGSSVTELAKLVDYYQQKRGQLADDMDLLTKKQTQLNLKLTKLKSTLAFNEGKTDKIGNGKMILQVMNEGESTASFQITYLTQSASWKPFYDLRVDQLNTPVKVVYKADVKQNSGIDWRGIKLSLTSGQMNESNAIPQWDIWFLDYYQAPPYMGYTLANTDSQTTMMRKSSINTPATKEESNLADYINVNESQLNLSFDISIPYTIASNGKTHSVTLDQFTVPTEYKYYTAPKLDPNAYLVATVKNYASYNFLPGEANVIFDGVYVGKTYLNPFNKDEEMQLNMGKDTRIILTRTLLKNKSGNKILSSDKIQDYQYNIAVNNTKNTAITIQVEDQYPTSANKDIVVVVTEKSGATVDSERGVLKWEVNLKSNESKSIKFGYQIKSNKDQVIQL